MRLKEACTHNATRLFGNSLEIKRKHKYHQGIRHKQTTYVYIYIYIYMYIYTHLFEIDVKHALDMLIEMETQ